MNNVNNLIESKVRNIKIVIDNLSGKMPNGFTESMEYMNKMIEILKSDKTITEDEVNAFFNNMEKILLYVFLVRRR